MIWSTRSDGFHDYYNDRWYEFTGVPAGSTDGEGWNGMFHPDDQERAWSVWRRCLETGETYHIEYRLRHRTGQYRWVLGRAQPVRDEDGRTTRWYGSCTDIHEQVLARESLAKSREHLETAVRDRTAELADLYTKTPVALHSLDASERLISVSDRWLAFMGYDSRDEVIGRSIVDFISAESLAAHDSEYRQSLFESGVVEDLPCVCIKKSGELADVLVSARTTIARDGTVSRIMASIVDVTERKRAEAARDMAEAALRQSQKLETIGQLTGGVAHDFNNLLMAIRSNLELMLRRLPAGDDRLAKRLENAILATDRGAGLTQRMLAFARKQELDAQSVNVEALLEGTRDLLERSLGPQVEISYALSPDTAEAHVDANQLELALLNLCVNGRDAMDGNGRLTIMLDNVELRGSGEPGSGEYVRIAITDSGTGMDAATLAQAMEPFFTTKGVGKGTGLGLSMVYGFASQSGGTLQLSSEPGKGTTAELLLPVAKDAVRRRPVETVESPVSVLRTEKATILAVDDDALVLMGTTGLLEDMGYEVLEANSGKKALEILATRTDIDLVITDHAMPKMTGVQLAELIHDGCPDLPVILATGYAEMPEGGERHISVRLEKPFSEKRLSQAIAQALPSGGSIVSSSARQTG
ncbi:hybrid sensor histidine kinase/response regulator [uncultured Jannaschia sp.]|uniref:hybrid sensor histidine kinase/response regulator n=1 Tax=uncultured Jannaschia sp. TaxID=293347 RepID=UPI0026275680|nr:hybrid sensor histidine kinase/response regulator [uncultured Jannaschia sp.]